MSLTTVNVCSVGVTLHAYLHTLPPPIFGHLPLFLEIMTTVLLGITCRSFATSAALNELLNVHTN